MMAGNWIGLYVCVPEDQRPRLLDAIDAAGVDAITSYIGANGLVVWDSETVARSRLDPAPDTIVGRPADAVGVAVDDMPAGSFVVLEDGVRAQLGDGVRRGNWLVPGEGGKLYPHGKEDRSGS